MTRAAVILFALAALNACALYTDRERVRQQEEDRHARRDVWVANHRDYLDCLKGESIGPTSCHEDSGQHWTTGDYDPPVVFDRQQKGR